MFFDENLDFKYHLRKTSSKLSRALFALHSVKKILPSSALISLYYALFHCHLVYAIEIWSCASWSNINELYLKQKAAIRIISNSTYNAHTQPLFKKLKILPLNLMVDFFNPPKPETFFASDFHDFYKCCSHITPEQGLGEK